MAQARYAIALGSNRRHGRHGAPRQVLGAALHALSELGEVERSSTLHSTAALGPAGRGFANAVAILASDLLPDRLLAELKKIEKDFGRRSGKPWGPRVLDLDIILWSEGAWGGAGPIVPHPEFRGRSFVLAPLDEVAARWRDPIGGNTVRQLLARHRRARPVDPPARRS